MNETISAEPTAEEAAQMEAEILAIFAAIDRIDARIEANQKEIDRLKAKTNATLAQLRAH